ncbi:MAG TPA: hypothetical protein VFJ58_26895 [Armatimonadota bacterium]|nr:hypothetical protein [Armatimonadota bacterium]
MGQYPTIPPPRDEDRERARLVLLNIIAAAGPQLRELKHLLETQPVNQDAARTWFRSTYGPTS